MVLDNFSSGYMSNFQKDSGSLTIIDGDVNSDKALDAAFKCKPDFVFHLAAQFANQNSVDHPVEDFNTNANGTIRVLEYCRRSEGLLRMVYASSSCVLGRHHRKMTEGTQVAPETPYAVSKLTGELYALTFYRESSLSASRSCLCISRRRICGVSGILGRPPRLGDRIGCVERKAILF